MTGVLVPPLAESVTIPEGLEVRIWDGSPAQVPADDFLERIAFYVQPYTFAAATGELIGRMPSLRVVQTLTAGYEHVVPYLRAGLTLCNARGVHDTSTAELAVTLLLSSMRGIPGFVQAQARHEWAPGWRDSLADRTVLIVGYGSIGQAIEARIRPFECDVLRVARTERDGVAGIDSLPSLLGRADVVIVVVPLTDQTRHLVDATFLTAMRDGALLVNVARGGVVDTDALVAEVMSERLRAALDVTDPEPLPADHPLWEAPGVLITPHVGGPSSAFEPRARALIQAQLFRFAAGEPLENIVRYRLNGKQR
jgi:phosphoglycerate dehydrogenase-like enzyme